MKKYIVVALCGLSLTGCMEESKDYDASAYCQGQGMRPGDPGYDTCIRNEKTGKLMDQQQKDFDQMRQQQQDIRMQPNNGRY